jgi:ketosteroid isomerase-like protein
MDTAQRNKQTLRAAFDALAQGDGRPFVAAMADDFAWDMTGTTAWSGRYEGKAVVREQVLKPLFAQFATQYTNTATRFIAEDDMVVVECRGQVTTNRGKPYNNTYCYVCRFNDAGQMIELVEYFDTELVTAALEPPQRA